MNDIDMAVDFVTALQAERAYLAAANRKPEAKAAYLRRKTARPVLREIGAAAADWLGGSVLVALLAGFYIALRWLGA